MVPETDPEQLRWDFEAEALTDEQEANLKKREEKLQKKVDLIVHNERLQKAEAEAMQREHPIKVEKRKVYVRLKSGEK